MCGIVVVIGKNSKEKAKESLDKLQHRGVDSFKIETLDDISIGFTRLAINDNSRKGEQPFSYTRYIGIFNAEVYNHKELEVEHKLELNGQSDCEVILPLYAKYEKDTIALLDGFFSGVIYDKIGKKIYILRDYIGKKPLFFAYDEECIYIVSELKSLPKVKYFEMIPKGLCELKNRTIHRVKTYNNLNTLPKNNLKEVLLKAVKKRIIGIENMKIGVFLSGGLDSSIMAMIMHTLLSSDKVHYYCLANSSYEDLQYINIMKDFLNISDNNISYLPLPKEKELLSLLGDVVYATESYNPSIISNGIAAYILSKKVQEDGLKVVITGDGADELFFGYQDKNIVKEMDNWREIQESFIDDLHLTELRRIDLACMANTVEIRCPFLDKQVYTIAKKLEYSDFFGTEYDSLNKNILRKVFEDDLPKEIINRKKVSFDVGSGLQKMLIDLCKKNRLSEVEYLKKIWDNFFNKNLSKLSTHSYFWSYPQFDKAILRRGDKYE